MAGQEDPEHLERLRDLRDDGAGLGAAERAAGREPVQFRPGSPGKKPVGGETIDQFLTGQSLDCTASAGRNRSPFTRIVSSRLSLGVTRRLVNGLLVGE